MKNKTKLTGAELNCIEIAVQHHIDELEDALADTGTGWKSAYKKDEYKMLKERLKATQSVKKKLWNLGGLIDDLEQSHYPCLLYTSPSPRDGLLSRMPSSA